MKAGYGGFQGEGGGPGGQRGSRVRLVSRVQGMTAVSLTKSRGSVAVSLLVLQKWVRDMLDGYEKNIKNFRRNRPLNAEGHCN